MKTYKFRVILDTKEDVFRDIEIGQEKTFEDLYKGILSAFDFLGKELASFYISDNSWEKGREIGLMDMSFGEEEESNLPLVMKRAVLQKFVQESDQKFILVYDFLKIWIFYIELKALGNSSNENSQVVLTFGDAPSENSKEIEDLMAGIDFEGTADDTSSSSVEKDDELSNLLKEMDEETEGDEFGGFENIDDLDI